MLPKACKVNVVVQEKIHKDLKEDFFYIYTTVDKVLYPLSLIHFFFLLKDTSPFLICKGCVSLYIWHGDKLRSLFHTSW